MGWQPDVVCDNTHAQQITVHLRSVRPRKLAHATDIFFSLLRKNTTRQQRLLRFLFLKLATRARTPKKNNSRRLRTTTGRVTAPRRAVETLKTFHALLYKIKYNNIIMFPPTRSVLSVFRPSRKKTSLVESINQYNDT